MVKKRNEAGARGLSPEGSAAEAKRMRRQTAKDDRARRRRTGGTPSRAQGVRQRAGGAFPRRRRRSPTGLPFLLRQAIPGLRRACSSLACAAYFPYASALAPALARLASGLPCLATKPFRGPAPCSGARMPRDLRDGALAPDSAIRLPDPPRHAGHFASPRCAGPAASLRSSAVRVYAWANPATKRASRGTRRNRRKSPKPKSGDDAGRRFS